MREREKYNKSINRNILSMRIMRHAWIKNLTSMKYVHNMMVMVTMKHDGSADKENGDDGGWHITDEEDGV